MSIYKTLIKPVLFKFDPERVHNLFINTGSFLGGFYLGRALVSFFYGYSGEGASIEVDGIKYRTPVVLSAGFDYNGHLSKILPSIGLGGEEVGSVTAKPSSGNQKPRLFRLPKNKSIIVNKGLANDGVDAIIARLKKKKLTAGFVLGVSIARTNSREVVTPDEGVEDYAESLEKLVSSGVGDYYTINISCPNAYGGESFTTPDLLHMLMRRLAKIKCNKPLYVKMPISLDWHDFQKLLDVLMDYEVSGVVIGNLNKNYEELEYRDEAPNGYSGGLSGYPTKKRSNDLIERTRGYCGDRFTIIGCGGVMSEQDAMEKLSKGADLIQMITGLIYEGPSLPSRIAEAYVKQKINLS